MDKERIRNRRERLKVQKDLMYSLCMEVFVHTRILGLLYRDLEVVQGLEVALMMSETKDKLNLIADQLRDCAKFISSTAAVVGCDADEIFNSTKSMDYKQ